MRTTDDGGEGKYAHDYEGGQVLGHADARIGCISQLVYKMYGLTDAEICVVEEAAA